MCRSATRYWGCIPDRIINRNTLMALIFVRWKGAIITFESIEAVVREWTVLFRLIIPGHSHLSNYWLWRFRFKNHLSMRWCCSSFLLPSLINANVEKILHVLEPFNSSWPNYVLISGMFPSKMILSEQSNYRKHRGLCDLWIWGMYFSIIFHRCGREN